MVGYEKDRDKKRNLKIMIDLIYTQKKKQRRKE